MKVWLVLLEPSLLKRYIGVVGILCKEHALEAFLLESVQWRVLAVKNTILEGRAYESLASELKKNIRGSKCQR
nr:hypothetical protein [Tanacetum cinerariifolium]